MQMISYSGNGDYCYANSLYMSLLAAGAKAGEVPTPGFLECLTTLPFGKMYLRLDEGPLVFFSSSEANPDLGLTLAVQSLGWECEETRGGSAEEALVRLRKAVQDAPVLAGPLDMGYLTYSPFHRELAGGDHFVLVLAVEEDCVIMHDPMKYPYASLPLSEFLEAWRADRVGYRSAPYTMRSHFRQVEARTRQEMIARALPTIRHNLSVSLQGPVVYNGVAALSCLIDDLRADEKPSSVLESLATFVFPLAARRSLDAAFFLREAGLPDAAQCMQRQAMLAGKAQYLAAHEQWQSVAAIMEQLAEEEQKLLASLEHSA
ncbi:MAG TPA: hypothetical protein VFA41_13050 [Ktedonobacteraceae bacterium]|jgi:hypothetical protein|nr:hypothetical protein [Ktedonobacteraceae bacterium]